MRQQTLAIHACSREIGDAPFVASSPPLEMAASYHFRRAKDMTAIANGEMEGYVYQRYGNPSAAALHRQIGALEGAASTLACSSGMAAMHVGLLAAMRDRPARILAANVLFGQTFQLLQLMEPLGVTTQFVDAGDVSAIDRALDRRETGCVLVETVSNPLIRVPPVDRICEVANRRGVPVVVDATMASPAVSRPLDYGASVVVHSASKYLAGHADVLGGIVSCGPGRAEDLQELGRLVGPNLGPFPCFLTIRGIKTLPMRMEEHSRNAQRVARVLAQHPRVGAVHYPGLEGHPDKSVAERLFLQDSEGATMFGGMVGLELRDADRAIAFRFVDALRLVVRTISLGDVHSQIVHPATTTHRNLAEKHRQRLGIGDSLLRLSVGIEDSDDIVEDLVQALDSLN